MFAQSLLKIIFFCLMIYSVYSIIRFIIALGKQSRRENADFGQAKSDNDGRCRSADGRVIELKKDQYRVD